MEETLDKRSDRSLDAPADPTNDRDGGVFDPSLEIAAESHGARTRIGSRTFWCAQLAFWGGFGAVTYLTFLGQLEPGQRLPVALLKLVIRPVLGLGTSTLLMLGYQRWLERGRMIPEWLASAVVVLVCTGLALLWYLASSAIYRPFNPFPGPVDWAAQIPRSVLEYVFVLLAWSTGYFWLRSRHDADRRSRQALRADAAARTAQLELLAHQLNPHFLFNALTSLRGLIHEDPDRADAVLGRLAAFLRRTLARPATEVGPLADELAHVASYLEVERSRHGPGLEVNVDVRPPAEQALIPAFLLHPLVENAVNHGQARDGEPRRVEIRAELDGARLRVTIANPGTVASTASTVSAAHANGPGSDTANRTGIGLRNARHRLAQYSPGSHELRLLERDGWVHAVLEIDQNAVSHA